MEGMKGKGIYLLVQSRQSGLTVNFNVHVFMYLCIYDYDHDHIHTLSPVSKCDLKGIQCQFWDLGGGGDLPKLWPKYYAEAHAVFFVIDCLEIKSERLMNTLSI